jgi:two-component system chemotaxis response regulator CheB
MTGMGRDGVEGCRAIRQAGGYVLGQDEATSDVYGMNKVAYVEGCVDRQFALDEAPSQIAQEVRRLLKNAADPPHRPVAAGEASFR